MPRFSFVAQDKDRKFSRGVVEAETREAALQSILGKGLSPIKLEELQKGSGELDTKKKGASLSMHLSFHKGLTLFDQINLLRHLGTILNTGTDLLSGLDIIAKDTINPFVKEILYDVRERVGKGQRFSEAIYKWKDQFNPVFVNLVKSAEESGTLPKTLIMYAQELRKDFTFLRKLRGALTYPIILLLMVLLWWSFLSLL
jgi:type IV pilus assembly protein PilC